MRKLLLTLFILITVSCLAYDFSYEYEGATLYYEIKEDNTCKVVSNFGYYSGDIVIPANVTYNDVEYPVTEIGFDAFGDCVNLTSVVIPKSVTRISREAFWACKKLTNITLSEGVTSIGNSVFCKCYSLESVTILGNLTDVGRNPFSACPSLKSFYGNCTSEDNRCLIIDDILISFAPYGLSEYVIPNNVQEIAEGAFYECSTFTEVIFPENLKIIGDEAFSGCKNLIRVSIPNHVTLIGGYAFEGCSKLSTLEIGASIKEICHDAFEYCHSLSSIYIYVDNPFYIEMGSSVFRNSNLKNCTLYVPIGSSHLYELADPWCNFKEIIEFDTSNISDTLISTPEDNQFYDINGRPILYNTGKGLIISNGKKTYKRYTNRNR